MARRRRSTSLGETTRTSEREQLRHRRPRRRRFPWFVLLLLVLGTVVFFAPQIVTQTTLKDRLIQWALPPGAAHVDAASIRASWFAPIELNQVELHDVAGQPLVSVAKVTTEKRLLDLVTNYKSLGTIYVEQPHLNLVVTESGSNLQEALATLVTSDESNSTSTGTSSPVSLGLEVKDGRIDVVDQVSGTQSAASNINLSLQVPAANESALVLKLAADTIQGQQSGSLNADVTWQPPPQVSAKDLGSGQVTLKSNQFPLPILGPLLTRTVPDLRLDGQLDTDLTCSWKNQADGPALHAVGTVGIRDALFAMASVLGRDELRSRNTTAELDASINQSQLIVERLHTQSELGQLAITGTAPVAELLAEDLAAQLLAASSRHQLRAEGRIDLAALATALPETLKLRAGTNITDGSLDVVASSTNDPQGRRFSATASTTQLAGIAQGQAVRWDQPVEVKLVGRPVGSQWIVDRLEANSQFLQVVGNGSLAEGQFQATGDLGVMLAEAQKFCDVGSLQLAGLLDSTGNWQTDANGRVAGKMEAGFKQFVMAYDDVEPWRENQLTLTGSVNGQLKSDRIERVDQASATLVSGGDQLEVLLTNAVTSPSAKSTWPIRASLRGNIETWLARLKPWVSTGGWNVTGAVQATAAGAGSMAQVALDPIEVNLTDVRAASGSQVVVDPLVKLNATARWDQPTQRVVIPSATVASSTLALRAQDVDISLAPESFSATGATSFRTDLQRLAGWFADPKNPSTTIPQGLAVGSVRLTTTGQQVQFEGQGKVTDLIINTLSAPVLVLRQLGIKLGTRRN